MKVGTDKAKVRIRIINLKTGKTKTVTSYYDNGIADLAKDIVELIEERHAKRKSFDFPPMPPLSKFKKGKKKVKK